MKNWEVFFKDYVTYANVEAETKEEAIQIALEWWIERTPMVVSCEEMEGEDDNDEMGK